ncbi:hypothetical protein [Wolbachia endosymbiont of Wuchereria bancrofti]|nr:hypothetical protein [Wolbachia endosymbiont of Wuchereria bancrofti]
MLNAITSYFKSFFKENKATKAEEINNQPIDTGRAVGLEKNIS